MTWGFIWLMFVLKIPILMLLGIVYWAVKQSGEPAEDDAEKVGVIARPHPPTRPRRRGRPRGPHGDGVALPAPPRIRPVTAIGAEAAAREHTESQG
jgi:hypothetical protein